ncbi:MAG: GGDEF domain-containing protein [Bryobacteraceae bacterium]
MLNDKSKRHQAETAALVSIYPRNNDHPPISLPMISLRYHVEQHREEALATALECCKSLVASMANNGARVCPSLGNLFQDNLMLLAEQITGSGEKERISATTRQIEHEVDDWGGRASDYYSQKAAEVREIMLAMTEAAKAATRRDEKYSTQFNDVSAKLQQVGTLEDLTEIRELVSKTAADLSACAERMLDEGAQSIAGLQAQLDAYEQRLQQSERKSETDTLTGLANRAGIERAMREREGIGQPFSVLVVDLNDFKEINDTHGHSAGDDLLKQFADEFRSQFRPQDIVGRWGGDEFVAVTGISGPREVQERVERIRNWACGNYALPGVAEKVHLTASVGVAVWRPGMSAHDVFAEADKAMYGDKKGRR